MKIGIWIWILLTGLTLGGAAELELIETEDAIEVRRDGQTMFVYNIAVRQPPEGIEAVYERSGFIHPVFTPRGQVVTDAFPADHPHQHALFFAWTKTHFKGKLVDFWNTPKLLGRVFHDKVLAVERGEGWVSFSVALKHQELVSEAKEIVLNEVWKVTAHEAGDGVFVFDLESVQNLATDEALVLDEYHYGGAGFRYTGQWGMTDGVAPFEYLLSGGQGRLDGNHTEQRWVAANGVIDGEAAGVAVLSHPENFRSPQRVRLHPKMPYFCFSPVVSGAIAIEKDKPYRSSYRYIIGSGALVKEGLDARWDQFAAE